MNKLKFNPGKAEGFWAGRKADLGLEISSVLERDNIVFSLKSQVGSAAGQI